QSLTGQDVDLPALETSLQGVVSAAGAPVSAAEVIVASGHGDRFTVVRSDGQLSLPVRPGSTLSLTTKADGFETAVQPEPAITGGEARTVAIELIPASSLIRGVIRSESGQPVPGATVGTDQLATESAFDGTYVLHLPPGSREVSASAPGFGAQRRTITLALGEQRDGIDFQLTPEFAQVVIQISGAAGASISGAVVTVESQDLIQTAVSDASGGARLVDLPPGTYSLGVAAEGFEDYLNPELSLVAGATRQVQVILVPRESDVVGRVVDTSANGVPGVHIEAVSSGTVLSTTSADDGRFELKGVDPGPVDIRFEREGFEASVVSGTVLVVGANDLGTVTLLRHAGSLAGTVTASADGRELSGVRVTAIGTKAASSTTSTDQGRYTLSGLPPGSYEVEATLSGFRRAVASVDIGPGSTLDLQLVEADGSIRGRVLDETGASLGFPVRVAASAASRVVAVISEEDGNFVLTGLDPGEAWTIRTEINRPGYLNATREVSFPDAGNSIVDANLTVPVRRARIEGNAGIADAAVRLVDPSTGETTRIARTLSNGTYAFSLLAAGDYTLVPVKEGVSFTPPSITVSVSQTETRSVNFTAVAQVGAVHVQVLNVLRQPIPGVAVVLGSTNGLVVRSGTTDLSGLARFEGLPLSLTYSARPSLAGFSGTPRSQSILIDAAEAVRLEFTMIESTGRISGSLSSQEGAPLSGSVSALDTETGILYRTNADAGIFLLEQLPGGVYDLTAVAPGFREEVVRLVLAEGEDRTGVVLSLRPANVRLQGRVLYRGEGLPGLTVIARARTEQQAVTDAGGNYVFANLPLDAPAPDTTVYTLTVQPEDGDAVNLTVFLPGDRIGQVVNADDIVLPSGQLTVIVTDGVLPLAETAIVITGEGGASQSGVTDADGRFATTPTLQAGGYRISLSRDGYLLPSGGALEPDLTGDTDAISIPVALPFRHDPVEVAASNAETSIAIDRADTVDPAAVTGSLTYTVRGVTETLPLVSTGGTLAAAVPPANGEEPIRYALAVTWNGLTYRFGPHTVIPRTPGKLTALRIEPSLAGNRLRVGDTYSLRAVMLDGIGSNLSDRFAPGAGGRVQWSVVGDHATIVPDPADPARAELTVGGQESVRLELTAVLASTQLSEVANFQVDDEPLSALTLSSPVPVVGNQGQGIQLNYRARLEDGSEQLIGNGLSWSVVPPGAGRVSASGVFHPEDPEMIGPVTIQVLDPASGKTAETRFSLVRELAPGEGALLRGSLGADLLLPAGAIPFASRIGLSYPALAGPKRNATVDGVRFTAGDGLVRYSMSSDRALLGDSLLADARIELVADGSLRLLEGERFIGQFVSDRLAWRLLPTERLGDNYSSSAVRRLAEFTVLAANEGLGLRNVAVLPSPFSPDLAPLKIGFVLTSQESAASVSVRVFNLQG
ncbi:MAG: carboxypeptidase regulatory-like domain-containing protein, partial [Rhodothermales bacterium]|nr:carboxypeptidase regulatory-like domain-containing protein [Rhodothermales bacterium]